MKAIVYEQYGSPDVLKLKDVKKPAPRHDEVLIKIHATTVTSADARLRSSTMPFGFWFLGRLYLGMFRPRKTILGVELAGEIESVGKDVSKYKAGDQVFGMSGVGLGAYAEYKCLPEDAAMALKPVNLSVEDAAAIAFGGATSLVFLRDRGKIRSGEKVLVIGASGCVGTAAVQLAKYFGADVTGVCSGANRELVKSIGADSVIDYTQEDFTKNGERYDIIMDTVGVASVSRSKGSLNAKGRLLLVVAGLPEIALIPWVAMTSRKRIIAGPVPERAEDLRFLKELVEAGKFKPTIDRRYRLEQMAEAHAYVDTGRKKGNVVITI